MEKSFKFRNPEFGKFRFKKSNTTSHFGNHGYNRAIDNLSVRSLASFKSELNMATRLHLHLRTKTQILDGYPMEYCIVFYLNIVDCLNWDMVGQWNLKYGIGSINGEAETFDFASEENNLDESMFIGTIEVTKKRKSRIPCLIRLQTMNDCPLVIGQTNSINPDSFGFSWADVPWGSTYESTFTIKNGEVDKFAEGGVLEKPELPEQMVKSRAKVVADISDNKRNIGRNSFKLLKPENILSCIAVSFNLIDNLVWVSFEKPLNQATHSLEMISCSAEFEKTAIKRMHMLQYPYGEENGRKETKDTRGTRDSHPNTRRIRAQSKKGSKAEQVNASKPVEVTLQTLSAPRFGGYTAKHIRSGRLEDA